MEFEINKTIPRAGYTQLADQLRGKIASGEYADRLPSLTELCELSGLSMSTVQHAIRVLKEEGLVVAVRGLGTFVRNPEWAP